MDVNKSPTMVKYKDTLKRCIRLYYPSATPQQLDAAIDYSINKRIYNANAKMSNSYKRYREKVLDEETHSDKLIYKDLETDINLLALTDYIMSREPIVTAFGTMFMHHATVPNPLVQVVQSFLDNRTAHKKQMFQYPKGSEDFMKYNLLQSLTIV